MRESSILGVEMENMNADLVMDMMYNPFACSNSKVFAPELVSTLEEFPLKKVVCGNNHTAALSEDGLVFSWGMGGTMFHAGGLGHGDKEHQPMPVVIDYFYDNVNHVSKVYLIDRALKLKISRVVATSW